MTAIKVAKEIDFPSDQNFDIMDIGSIQLKFSSTELIQFYF